jgi:hypothetical protein
VVIDIFFRDFNDVFVILAAINSLHGCSIIVSSRQSRTSSARRSTETSIIAIDRRAINSVPQPMFTDALFFSRLHRVRRRPRHSAGVQDDPIIIKRFA